MSNETDLLKGTIEIDGRAFEFDLNRETAIQVDPSSLNESLASNPNRYAVWAMMEQRSIVVADDLKGAVDLAERELDTLEARVYLEIMAAGGQKPPTIPTVQAMVKADERVVKAKRELNTLNVALRDAKARVGICAVGRKAIEQKMPADIARGYMNRREQETKTSIAAEAYRPGPGTGPVGNYR